MLRGYVEILRIKLKQTYKKLADHIPYNKLDIIIWGKESQAFVNVLLIPTLCFVVGCTPLWGFNMDGLDFPEQKRNSQILRVLNRPLAIAKQLLAV